MHALFPCPSTSTSTSTSFIDDIDRRTSTHRDGHIRSVCRPLTSLVAWSKRDRERERERQSWKQSPKADFETTSNTGIPRAKVDHRHADRGEHNRILPFECHQIDQNRKRSGTISLSGRVNKPWCLFASCSRATRSRRAPRAAGKREPQGNRDQWM